MVNFASDTEMLDIMCDELYASVISDVIDSLGARNQGVRLDVRPIYEGAMVVGRADPVLTADVYKFIDDPYEPEIDAVDSLKPNDVMVVCTQRIHEIRRHIVEGYGNQIIMSHDICAKTRRVRYGGWGYAPILNYMVPMMCQRGMTQEHTDAIINGNPQRLLTHI